MQKKEERTANAQKSANPSTVDTSRVELSQHTLPARPANTDVELKNPVSGIGAHPDWMRMGVEQIERDKKRFDEIVDGRIRRELKKYISNGEMIGRKGKDLVSIPIPGIDPPRFRFGKNGSGGVGQGEGNPGDPIAGGQPQPGQGSGQGPAGSEGAEHVLEVERSIEDLGRLLGEELELPRIEPKGQKNIHEEHTKYTGIRRTGSESLRHFKRSFLEGLRRQIASGTYDPKDPHIVVEPPDKRYRSPQTIYKPMAQAAIIYIMDVSGSMSDQQKELVRTEAFWIDAWLKTQYPGVEKRYIIHDAAAKAVDEHTFYNTRESGGTRISSAYKVAVDIIKEQFPLSEWNVYVFQFSDGDNYGDDNRSCIEMLKKEILPVCNMFCYGQVEAGGYGGSGEYMKTLKGDKIHELENVAVSEIKSKEDILGSIKTFLGKAK